MSNTGSETEGRAARAGGELPPPPTFLIIGAQKCATRWLRFNLQQHPEIHTADRELSFFCRDRTFRLGLDWYRSQFTGWSGEPVIGEATPGYMMWRNEPHLIAARIDDLLPGVRLIALLRDPVERALSAFVHHMRNERLRPDADLFEVVGRRPPEEDPLGIVAGGWYARSLRPFHERFADRLLVLLHDDVIADSRAVYRRALEHLGVDPSFVPPELEVVRHSHRGDAGSTRVPTAEEVRRLFVFFAEDVVELETMLGLAVPAWKGHAT